MVNLEQTADQRSSGELTVSDWWSHLGHCCTASGVRVDKESHSHTVLRGLWQKFDLRDLMDAPGPVLDDRRHLRVLKVMSVV